MTPIDRAAIREALAKATRGPWHIDEEDGGVWADDHPGDSHVATLVTDDDAHLIANAPAWLAGLLEALEEAERSRVPIAAYNEAQRGEARERQRADAAEARVKELEDEARTCRGGHNHNTLRKLNAKVARLQERQSDRLAALESQVKVKDEALHAAKSQITQYWAYLSSDRVEDAEAILDAALATTKDVDHG